MGPRISDELKKKAVEQFERKEKTIAEIRKEFGVQTAQFKSWRTKFSSNSNGTISKVPQPVSGNEDLQAQLKALSTANEELNAEIARLKTGSSSGLNEDLNSETKNLRDLCDRLKTENGDLQATQEKLKAENATLKTMYMELLLETKISTGAPAEKKK